MMRIMYFIQAPVRRGLQKMAECAKDNNYKEMTIIRGLIEKQQNLCAVLYALS
jgi:hypothetical protein